jgi:2,3-bisphosphoglycerate-independent phosphoglycerate mutase
LPSGSSPLVALVILDGWGCAPPGRGNAVELADTPVFDRLWRTYPHTTLDASGEAVGLPPGQMGNSEVGHLTIGSGRRLYQDLMRVNRAIADGSVFENPALRGVFERGRRVHLLGLVSEGGVHSHIDHLRALLTIAPEKTWIHAFTDGRDVSPHAAVRDLATLPEDRIATVAGRYYAMDRDARWDRTQRAFDAIVQKRPVWGQTPAMYVKDQYEKGITDEFIEPVHIEGRPGIEAGDTALFFNFRPDRGRQLTRLLLHEGVDLTTMTRYSEEFDCPVLLGEQRVSNTMAEVLADSGLRQLHVAETEKYAHVTYFFNGGREEPLPGEDRRLVPSPKVATYDLQPEMSAPGVTDALVEAIGADRYDFIVGNFANPDMVGHTGVWSAAVSAVETVDGCLGRVVETLAAVDARDPGGPGSLLAITADHGNADRMRDEAGQPVTAHSLNPVPLLLAGRAVDGRRLRDGVLADVAPTLLELAGLPRWDGMTGHSLLVPTAAAEPLPTGPAREP